MAELKMDVDQVEAFAGDLRNRYITELNTLKSSIQNGATNLNWIGPDAEQFKNSRVQEVTTQIGNLVSKLEELAGLAASNAAKQRETSGAL